MKRVAEYITENENRNFCSECNEICSRHCVIWRKAEIRCMADKIKEEHKEEQGCIKAD